MDIQAVSFNIVCPTCKQEATFVVRVKNIRGIRVDVYVCEEDHKTEVPVTTTDV